MLVEFIDKFSFIFVGNCWRPRSEDSKWKSGKTVRSVGLFQGPDSQRLYFETDNKSGLFLSDLGLLVRGF